MPECVNNLEDELLHRHQNVMLKADVHRFKKYVSEMWLKLVRIQNPEHAQRLKACSQIRSCRISAHLCQSIVAEVVE